MIKCNLFIQYIYFSNCTIFTYRCMTERHKYACQITFSRFRYCIQVDVANTCYRFNVLVCDVFCLLELAPYCCAEVMLHKLFPGATATTSTNHPCRMQHRQSPVFCSNTVSLGIYRPLLALFGHIEKMVITLVGIFLLKVL